jgi:hypothetical protein
VTLVEVTLADLLQGPIEDSRPHLDLELVDYYLEHLDEAPPVTVFDTGEGLLLADGYHRVAAAQRLGRTAIRAEVRQGNRSGALRFAVELAKQQRDLTDQQVLDAIKRRSDRLAT